MQNIDELKTLSLGKPRYRLKNADVFVSCEGLHFIDYLDPVEEMSSLVDEGALTGEEILYIEKKLQANPERFENQVMLVERYLDLESDNFRLLDVGCGGGLFLSKIARKGHDVCGIELADSRICYAQKVHSLRVEKHPIESVFWQKGYEKKFHVITMWDVVEHVNFPVATVSSARKLLDEGGYLFMDTPCRDSFYHRVGELTYKFSLGKFPTFLNLMYSAHLFGHKQIFSTKEIALLLEDTGFEVVKVKKFHELSFPYEYYLKKMLRKDVLVRLAVPLVNLFFKIFPIRNKMYVVAKKRTCGSSS